MSTLLEKTPDVPVGRFKSTLIDRFAEKYRVRVRYDKGSDHKPEDRIIPGRWGELRGWNDKQLRLIFMPDPHRKLPENHPTHTRWDHRSADLKRAGCQIHLDCHGEGVALFDVENRRQSELAIKVCGIHQKQVPTEASLKALSGSWAGTREARIATLAKARANRASRTSVGFVSDCVAGGVPPENLKEMGPGESR